MTGGGNGHQPPADGQPSEPAAVVVPGQTPSVPGQTPSVPGQTLSIDTDTGASAGFSAGTGAPAAGHPGGSGPVVIEVTTGAPLAALPQRAPRIVVPFAGRAGPATQPGVRTTDGAPSASGDEPGGTAPAVEEDFWLPIEEVHWDGTPITPTPRRWFGWFRRPPDDPARPSPRPPRPPRHPALGLAGSIALALVASFFAWVSAEPLWLAFDHGARGSATVTGCTGSGLGQQCRGRFTPADGAYTAWDIRLAGVGTGAREPGSRIPARMVGADSSTAYAGAGSGPLHLRWLLGLLLVLLCGAGIGWVSGAPRLPDRWSRRSARAISFAGPLLIAVGFVVAAR